jgi:hypothetical protein
MKLESNYFHDIHDVCQKNKLVLMGPDGYVSPHGAQSTVNNAGYYIREHCLCLI